jgi:glycosyltransferase involved in cell wall biosynthesis
MVEALAHTHEVRVVAPVPWTQRLRERRGQRADKPDLPTGVPVLYPTYFYTPGFLRTQYGRLLWACCRSTLAQVEREFAPDAYLGYWAHPDGEVVLRAANRAGRPATVIVGGSDLLVLACERARREAIRRVLLGADAVLTVGDALRERVLAFGVSPQRAWSFRRGVDTTLFCPGERLAARRRLALPPDRRAAVWVGRMVQVKGLEVLLQAWNRLDDKLAVLWLVGGGPLESRLRGEVARLGLADRVVFAGPRIQPELPDWYRAADLTVLPSLSEGMPNVLLESLACGTPFVASDVGGVREIASGGGDLVPPGEPSALAGAISTRLAAPRSATLPLGFTWDACAAAVTQVLASTLHPASGTAQ